MVVELESDWLVTQIELLKTLYGYEKNGVNDEIGSIDYVSRCGVEKKLLRVIINPEINLSKADTATIRKTKEYLENENYDEAVVLAEEVTQGAKRLIRDKKNLRYISPELGKLYSISEIIFAIQKKTGEICKLRCGKVPKTEKDCSGFVDGEYNCEVRRISDDADFHTERKWQQMLMKDFFKLVTL
jgi:hypothetical protein